MFSKQTYLSGALILALMVAVGAAALAAGPNFPPWSSSLVLALALFALSMIDLETGLLPNWLTLPLIALGLLQAWLMSESVEASLIGAVAGYTVFWTVSYYWRRVKGTEGLGLGDAKLLAAGGAWTGWMGLPFILLIASGAGLLAASVTSGGLDRARVIRFGPFLSLGIWCVWCFAAL